MYAAEASAVRPARASAMKSDADAHDLRVAGRAVCLVAVNVGQR
jgi:hypothetical protein